LAFEAPHTAGEVYRQIQLNPDAADTDRKRWLSHMSKCKEDILTKFLRKTEIVRALNRLLRFPGLWDGLQLGNLHKHKALHCDEEIIHYLGFVYETCDLITLGVDAFANAVDVDTVRRLEKLFPSHYEDLAAIRDFFRSNEVFTDITDKGERRSLEQSVCTVKWRISSIETLHKDMLYFPPAVRAIWKFVAPDRSRRRNQPTLRNVLKRHFHPIEGHICESGDECHHAHDHLGKHAFYLAYTRLLVFALQNFAELSYESPLCGKDGRRLVGQVQRSVVQRFQQRAYDLGFRTLKLEGRDR
ncbi:hypothetical protein F5883DRAFT_384728, partial [Diaporthe sp. PMI_573]